MFVEDTLMIKITTLPVEAKNERGEWRTIKALR